MTEMNYKLRNFLFAHNYMSNFKHVLLNLKYIVVNCTIQLNDYLLKNDNV